MPFIITVNSKRTPVSTPCGCDEGRRDVDAAKNTTRILFVLTDTVY